MLTLLIGGVRSGKSDFAVAIGERFAAAAGASATATGAGGVTFIATAERLDPEMDERIARHRADRPAWATIEQPLALAPALASAPSDHLVIIDCLTLWVSNAMFAEWNDDHIVAHARETSIAAAERSSPTVVVTNEVGLGVHPETEIGRRYRDVLGHVNRVFADAAHRSLFLVAGRALPLDDPWKFLE